MSVLGKTLYRFYYKPKSQRELIRKYGGKANYRLMLENERQMRAYAFSNLKIGPFATSADFKINFLTGEKFIHQSLFCLYSLARFLTPQERSTFSITIFDDGSLGAPTLEYLHDHFPWIRLVPCNEIIAQVDQTLPPNIYPFIRKKLETYAVLKKLIYVHAGNPGLNVYFDSDMLFFGKPDELISWLSVNRQSPGNSFGIHDVQRSYGYSEAQIKSIWSGNVQRNINSGLYAVHSQEMDFDLIEYLIKEFETRYGSNYYLEQLITGILLERSANLHMGNKADYIVFPAKEQLDNNEGVLHHYVDISKAYYFGEAWRKII